MSDYLQPERPAEKSDKPKGETPEAAATRWAEDLARAKKKAQKFWRNGQKAVEAFKGERKSADTSQEKRLNLYSANVQQVEAMLFAQVPTVDVERRFADANDGVARVSAELLQRLLNEDLHFGGEDQVLAFKQALSDRLMSGLGCVRVRYDAQIEQRPVTVPETGEPVMGDDGEPMTTEVKTSEEAEVVYLHWRDQLWDPLARTFSECRWWAFRVYMSRDELVDRFGEEGRSVPLNAKRGDDGDSEGGEYQQAEVWETWDKQRGEVCWYVEGHPRVLDQKPPPIRFRGFWPMPRPMFANLTTDELMPVADYALAEDLYREVNELATRRSALVKALKVAGVYDASAGPSVGRLLTEAADGDLIAVTNWAAFAEKGAIAGAMAFLPVEQVIAVVEKISEQIEIRKAEIYEVTGWSDVMRGQQVENGTPGEAQVKAHFASARLNAILEDFSRLCSDVQRLRAEVIAQHFDDETIIKRSNAEYTPDAQLVPQALQLIREDVSGYRICIKSDAMALADYGARRQEATELMAALGGFVQQAGNVVQVVPGSMPFLLELARWMVARLKGGQELGGLFDKAIAAAQQIPPQPAQQDPKTQALQLKGQQQMQAIQAKSQADLQHMQAETQQMALRQRDQAAVNIAEEKAKAAIKRGLPEVGAGGLP